MATEEALQVRRRDPDLQPHAPVTERAGLHEPDFTSAYKLSAIGRLSSSWWCRRSTASPEPPRERDGSRVEAAHDELVRLDEVLPPSSGS
jgi:hypothetical protein